MQKVYQLKKDGVSYILSVNPENDDITLSRSFHKKTFVEEIPKDISVDINKIIEGKFSSDNQFRLISPQTKPKPARHEPPALSLNETPTTQPIATITQLNFFQSSQKFISDYKNLLIAASLSGTIGAGIGLTLTYYDQIVSASMISNTLLLGLLAGLITLIYLVAHEYKKQYQTAAPSTTA